MESLEQLRKDADKCTQMAGVEDEFETVWITKSALLKDLDAIEREVEERYVELPKDADGEYIHIGDRVEDNERVARIVLTDGSWEPSVYIEMLPGVLHEHFCNEISHYHAPTVEDVLEEYRIRYYDLVTDMECKNITNEEYVQGIKELASEFAAKLQLKEDR